MHKNSSSSPNTSEQLLFVDVLNFGHQFFGGFRGKHNKHQQRWPTLSSAMQKVHSFVETARRSKFELEIFIDDAVQTEEAYIKWRDRREKEVARRNRGMPQGMNRLIGDMFKKEGIRVHYSLEADNDDTIVSHAYAHGAWILSQDKDMFRYGASIKVYEGFTIMKSRKELHLTPHRLTDTSDVTID